MDEQARASGDAGKPIVVANAAAPAAHAFLAIAETLEQRVRELPKTNAAPRVFTADPLLPIVE